MLEEIVDPNFPKFGEKQIYIFKKFSELQVAYMQKNTLDMLK